MHINDLFPEVLGEIFTEFTAAALEAEDLAVASYLGPLLLSHVCRYWRDVALQNHELWSFIFVSQPPRDALRVKPSIELVKTWLERSHEWPVDLQTDLQNPTASKVMALLRLLITHSARWRAVNFEMKTPLDWDLLGGGIIDAPKLTRLRASWDAWPWLPVNIPQAAAQAIPIRWGTNLRQLECPHIYNQSVTIMSQLHWASLREIWLYWAADADIVFIFTHCPLLESCTFPFLSKRAMHPNPELLAPNLRTLRVAQAEESGRLFIYNSLTCPQLEFLAVTDTQGESANSDPGPAILGFFARSRCALTYLELSSPTLRTDDLLQVLVAVTASLRILKLPIDLYDGLSLFLEQFDLKRRGEFILCPQLVWLSLPIIELRHYPVLTSSLESRWNIPADLQSSVVRLQTVEIPFWGESERGWTEPLKALKAAGMDITIDDHLFRNHNVVEDL
ncbi:hypothetical protein HMN09_00690200 [Mycena chlorophos]|uniref:F-box domain-containing protein n=1 Tax=Mycena chlorophos TaxID=658473 RepID=A0A8H6W7A5_MYCCL|nr:hypothetical protein HMN09_00690200 [Mycena chlorophos]